MRNSLLLLAVWLLFSCVPASAQISYISPNPVWHTATAPMASSVTVASTQIIAANNLRSGLKCTNLSTSASVFIAYGGNPAILNGGNAILPGATWTMADYDFSAQAINAIATAAAGLACQEFQ